MGGYDTLVVDGAEEEYYLLQSSENDNNFYLQRLTYSTLDWIYLSKINLIKFDYSEFSPYDLISRQEHDSDAGISGKKIDEYEILYDEANEDIFTYKSNEVVTWQLSNDDENENKLIDVKNGTLSYESIPIFDNPWERQYTQDTAYIQAIDLNGNESIQKLNINFASPKLTTQTNFQEIKEGEEIVIYINSEVLDEGTEIDWTIEGAETEDFLLLNDIYKNIDGIQGSSTLDKFGGAEIIKTKYDYLTEGDEEFNF